MKNLVACALFFGVFTLNAYADTHEIIYKNSKGEEIQGLFYNAKNVLFLESEIAIDWQKVSFDVVGGDYEWKEDKKELYVIPKKGKVDIYVKIEGRELWKELPARAVPKPEIYFFDGKREVVENESISNKGKLKVTFEHREDFATLCPFDTNAFFSEINVEYLNDGIVARETKGKTELLKQSKLLDKKLLKSAKKVRVNMENLVRYNYKGSKENILLSPFYIFEVE